MRPLLEAAAGPGVALKLELHDTVARAVLDRTQFEAVLVGLVANAREALEGSGEIAIRTSRAELDGAPATAVEVTDDGAGMPEDIRRQATEPFFTTKHGAQNVGMGLATTSGFVAQSRGQLRIESRPGIGTSVRMLLPAIIRPLAAVARDGAESP